jgi:hypothetical protein
MESSSGWRTTGAFVIAVVVALVLLAVVVVGHGGAPSHRGTHV